VIPQGVKKMTDQIKAEISEYFEREKNPPYDVDRRSQSGRDGHQKSRRRRLAGHLPRKPVPKGGELI